MALIAQRPFIFAPFANKGLSSLFRVSRRGVAFISILWVLLGGLLAFPAFATDNPQDAESKATVTDDDAKESVAQVIRRGRADVRQYELDYLSSLTKPNGSIAASDYVTLLRQELQDHVRAAMSAGSSEVELAVKRAAIQYKLGVINAYEAALGTPAHLFTTPFSVFSTPDLIGLESKLRVQLARLVEKASSYPEGRMPTQLVGRLQEVRHELDTISTEKMLRGSSSEPRTVDISSQLSVREAEVKYPSIARLAREAQGDAERQLAMEVEYRRLWGHSDAPLLKLHAELAKGHREAVLAPGSESQTRPDSWPPRPEPPDPSLHPTSSEGPLPPPTGNSLDELRAAAHEELRAAQRGEPAARAEAIARRNFFGSFVRLSTGTVQDPSAISLAAMSDAELGKFLEDYGSWESSLLDAKSRSGASWHGEGELAETRRWIQVIKAEKIARGPPPAEEGLHGPETLEKALRSGQTNAVEVMAFRDTAALELERERLSAMRAELDLPRAVPDLALENAYKIQQIRVLREEVASLNRLADNCEKSLTEIIRDGRGAQGEISGSIAQDAIRQMRGQAQAMEVALDHAKLGPPGAEVLKGIEFRSSLLRPPPIAARYRPESMGEIALKVRVAAGIQSLPRAPPVIFQIDDEVSKQSIRAAALDRPESSGALKSDFERMYRPAEAKSYTDLVSDIRRAPGGVIVDAPLRNIQKGRLQEIRYSVHEERFWARVDGIERQLDLRISPAIARAAWGFAIDGRVAAIDLRNPSAAAVTDLIRSVVPWDRLETMLPSDIPRVRDEIARLQSVNLHPALIDTGIGGDMIGADQLIFQVLKLAPVFKASDSRYRGIDVTGLRANLDEDLSDLRLGSAVGGYKSILSVLDAKMAVLDTTIKIDYRLKFEIFQLFGDQPPRRLSRVSEWFSMHDADLRAASPELARLLAFSSAVTLMRYALEANVPIDATELTVFTEDSLTPRFICRNARVEDCGLSTLRGLIGRGSFQ